MPHCNRSCYTQSMDVVKQPKKSISLLLLSILSFLALCYVLFAFPPGGSFSILFLHISYLLVFFVLFFISLYGLVAFFLKNALQGVTIAGFVVCFLLFRLFHLNSPFFVILLVVLFFCIEGIVWKRK